MRAPCTRDDVCTLRAARAARAVTSVHLIGKGGHYFANLVPQGGEARVLERSDRISWQFVFGFSLYDCTYFAGCMVGGA